MSTNQKISIVVIIFLVGALLDLPYGYYELLRLIVSLASAYSAYSDYSKNGKLTLFAIIFGVILLLYNPLAKVHLTRELWGPINLATAAAFLLFSIRKG